MSGIPPTGATAELLALGLAELLREHKLKVVFAESCTAGMVAAVLGAVPGISNHLCGSAVTYREQTKLQWLDIDSELIGKHTAESPAVTESMAVKVLAKTSEADYGVAVTGHLGPDAPPNKDGVIYVAITGRQADAARPLQLIVSRELRLEFRSRTERQLESTGLVLQLVSEIISQQTSSLGH